MRSQKHVCLNKTLTETTPVDMLILKERIPWGLKRRQRITSSQGMPRVEKIVLPTEEAPTPSYLNFNKHARHSVLSPYPVTFKDILILLQTH